MPRIEGDEYDDRLSGGGRADRIFGFGGPDTIYGAGGDDRLDGGAGHDLIYGDDAFGPGGGAVGDDTLYGRDGDDQLYSGGGGDLLDGGAGDDYVSLSLTGDPANDGAADTLVGSDGNDSYVVQSSSETGGDVVLTLSGDVLIDGAVVATVSGFESASFRARPPFSENPGDYRVTGTEGSDQITTRDGNDTLIGGAGDDFLDAGAGADRVDAGDGDDRLSLGDMGRDRVDLGVGDDRLAVELGEEAVGFAKYEGGEGDDSIFVDDSFGFDSLVFDGRTLSFDGVDVAEFIGFESIEIEGTDLTGLSGDDILYGTGSFGSPGVTDRLLGRGGDDDIDGRFGRNVMFGGAGDDRLLTRLDSRSDKLDGGAGEDRLVLTNAEEAVVMTGDLQTGFTVAYGGATAVLGKRFESLEIEGSSGDDVLIGGSGDDLVEIGEGSDVFSAFGGDDRVLVELDGLADQIDLGEGADVATLIHENETRVVMREGAGGVEVSLGSAVAATIAGAESFVVETGAGDDRLLGGELSDSLLGGEGRNVLFGRGGDDALGVTLDGALDEINGGGGVDRLIVERSRSFDDVGIVTAIDTDGAITLTVGGEAVVEARSIETVDITGTGDNDLLVGLSLDDVLRGVWGIDTLIGGDGDDLIILSGAGGSYRGGAGVDTADFDGWQEERGVELTLVAGETATLRAGDAEARLTGFENVVGSSEDDTITGDTGDNVIEGGDGDDLLDGGAGVDTLSYAGSGRGVQVDLAGGRAYGTFSGPTRDVDEIAGFENVVGSSGNDRIDGDDGVNRIEGGRSGDVLAGRGGADVFVFAAGDTQSQFYGSDYVTDFSGAEGDKIDLSAMAEALQDGGELAFVGEAAFSGAAGEIRYAGAGGGGIKLFVDLDGDAKVDETILLGDLTDIARDDLILA